jgi:hypothetical protein
MHNFPFSANYINMPAITITSKNRKKEISRCKTPVLLSFFRHNSDGVSSFLLKNTADILSEELKGKVKVGIAGDTGLMEEYDVRFLPMTVLIENNTVTDRIIGNPRREDFLKFLFK